MPTTFKWTPNTIVDNQIIYTGFSDCDAGDFVEFPDYKSLSPKLKKHPVFDIFIEKSFQSYLFATGGVNIFTSWQANDDDAMKYYIDNFSQAPNLCPYSITLPPVVDWENRKAMFGIDTNLYVKNQWYNHNQYHTFRLPARIEASVEHTSILCIRHDPEYFWNFKNVRISESSTVAFTKPNPSLDYFVFCMTNPVDLSTGKTIQPMKGYKLKQDSLEFTASYGEASIAILEKVGVRT